MKKIRYSETDYNQLDLPNTRKKQFFDIIKLEYRTLLKIGITLFIFFLPLFLILVAKKVYTIYVLPTVEDSVTEKYLADIMLMIFEVIGIMIFSLGISGVLRIYRGLAWQEGTLFKLDIKKTIFLTYKNYLSLSLLIGIILFIVFFSLTSLSVTFSSTTSLIIKIVIFTLLVLFFIPIILNMIMLMGMYSNKFKEHLRNSLKLFTKAYGFSVVIALVISSYYFISIIPILWLTITLQLIYVIVFLPLILLAWNQYYIYILDRYVNINYPEILNKGLVFQVIKQRNIKDQVNSKKY